MSEEWKDIPLFEGLYQVSNLGGVRSLDRTVCYTDGRVAKIRGKLLAAAIDGRGYPVVNLSKNGSARTHAVHCLVALAFLGERPFGDIHVRHLDGNALNPRLTNLAYGTRAENERDKIRHGRTNRGEKCGSSKLTSAQVHAIRTLLTDTDMPMVEIARLFGVSRATIGDIYNGRRWRYLTNVA